MVAKSHPLFERTRVAARDLAPFPWVMYQQDRMAASHLAKAMTDAGAAAPVIRVESASMSALVRLLHAGPCLACVNEALIDAQPDSGLRVVPVALDIWRFPTGMLVHRALEQYAPVVALARVLFEEVSKLKRGSPARAVRR